MCFSREFSHGENFSMLIDWDIVPSIGMSSRKNRSITEKGGIICVV